jgi:branched-chain amino acid transport system ATP-binding protein
MPESGGSILKTHHLGKAFRGFHAVRDVNLDVRVGEIHALVGPNGAGKTTLFNLLTGFLKPSAGRIVFDGEDITGLTPERVVSRGVARSFQITSLFERLSVLEHMELALHGGTSLGYRFWRSDRMLQRFRSRAMDLLDQVGLARMARVPAGSLPYGQKRALELALALALSPKLLLLDEPTSGMGLEDVDRTVELIRRVRDRRTVVMVEHNMKVVGHLADRVTVLQHGSVLVDGPYAEVRQDPRVVAAYLGESRA